MNFYDSFQFLLNHPIFNNQFLEGLDMSVVKVNPQTHCIDDNKTKNTQTRIWFETGPYLFDEASDCKWSHDLDLDCGGSTFEEAVINLAKLVENKYGRY